MATFSKLRDIGLFKHETDKYITIPLYMISRKKDNSETYACIWRELYLVDDLKANVLIGNDIIGLKDISIDISRKSIYISSCKIKNFIQAKYRGLFIWKKLLANANMVFLPRFKKIVPFALFDLPNDGNFLFYPLSIFQNLTFFSHLLDYRVQNILVCNNSDQLV